MAVSFSSSVCKETIFDMTRNRRPTTWVKWAYAFVRYIPILNGGYVAVGGEAHRRLTTSLLVRAVLALTADRNYPPSGCRGWIIDQLVVIECVTVVVEIVLVLRGMSAKDAWWGRRY